MSDQELYFIAGGGRTLVGTTRRGADEKLASLQRAADGLVELRLVHATGGSTVLRRAVRRLLERAGRPVDPSGWVEGELSTEEAEALVASVSALSRPERRRLRSEFRRQINGTEPRPGEAEFDPLTRLEEVRRLAVTEEQQEWFARFEEWVLHATGARPYAPITSSEEHERVYGVPPRDGLYDE